MTLEPGIHEIPLPARGGGARGLVLVDADDFAALSEYRWFLGSDGYARRFETIDGRRHSVAMHRQILVLARGDARECDHINGDRLDNRRANLRIVTRAENCQNVRQHPGRSGHRGVYWHPASGLWRVQIQRDGRKISGGYFERLEDAVVAVRELRQRIQPFAVEVRAA